MDADLKKLLHDDLGVSEEIQDKLFENDIKDIIDFATCEPEDVVKITGDHHLAESVTKLNDDAANIIGASNILEAARSTLGSVPQVGSDSSPMPNNSGGGGSSSSSSQNRGRGGNSGERVQETNSREYETNDDGLVFETNTIVHHGDRTNINIVNSELKGVDLCLTGDHQILNYITDEQKEQFKERRNKIRKGVYMFNGRKIDSGAMRFCEGDAISDERLDNIDAKGVSAGFMADKSPDDYYPLDEKYRALLLNNYNFDNPKHNRPEGKSDSERLCALLKQLGFHVQLGENKKGTEMMQAVEEFRNASKSASMILIFIGTHGGQKNNKDYFSGIDGKLECFESVLDLFTETRCPELKGKPKVFLNQFCRSQADVTEEYDSKVHAAQDLKDTLVVYSSTPGCKSFRGSKDGTWFINAFVKVLEEHSRKEDLLSMVTKVQRAVTLEKGMDAECENVFQMCEIKPTLTRKIYFKQNENEKK